MRIHLPMQGTQVQSLVQEDSTCHGTTKQGHHKYCAHAPQLLKSEHLGLYSTIREAAAVRSPCSETEWFHSPQLEKALRKPVKWKSLSCVQLFATPWTIHGILQSRILEWVAFPFSRGSSQSRDQTQVSPIAGRFFIS